MKIFLNSLYKIDTGDEHVHARIHQPLPTESSQDPQLHSIQFPKTREDEIEHF